MKKVKYLASLRKLTKNYCANRDIKEEDVELDLLDQKSKIEWPMRIVNETLQAVAPEEKEPRVRSV